MRLLPRHLRRHRIGSLVCGVALLLIYLHFHGEVPVEGKAATSGEQGEQAAA